MQNQDTNEARFFSDRPTEQITADCLGRLLTYDGPDGRMGGYIVEAEAYLGEMDSAAHAFNGRRTPSNEPLYETPGGVYIYSIHSQHCFDIVAQPAGVPQGILIRAIDPSVGIDLMEANRPIHGVGLTNGPGKLMTALGVHDKKLNCQIVNHCPFHMDLTHKRAFKQLGTGARVGVNQAGESAQLPLRYFVAGNRFVSGMRKRDYAENDGWCD